MLYNYNNFRKAIENKLDQIEFIGEIGLQKKSKSITSLVPGGVDTDTEVEKTEFAIEQIQGSIDKLNGYIKFIDAGLDTVKNDDYFEIIELMYFEGKSREVIAEHFEVDVSTITRHKKRLINTLMIYLFPEDSIIEFFS